MSAADLIEEIRANPEDDQLRLVYADSLLANGDERGEYIHLAIAASRDHTKVTPDQWARLSMLTKRERAWAKELGCEALAATWERGFPSFTSTDDRTLVAHLDALRRVPIQRVAISVSDAMEQLAAAPELAFLAGISVRGQLARVGQTFVLQPIPRHQLAALCASPNTQRLRRVELGENALTDETAETVGGACWLDQLEELRLGQLSAVGVERILTRELPRLRHLAIWGSRLGARGVQAIGRAGLPALDQLRLFDADVGDGALGPLQALRELAIEASALSDQGTIALAGTALPQLVRLGLKNNLLGDASAAALAGAQQFPRLTHVDLTGNQLTRDGALAFAKRTGLPALQSLGLSRNPMTTGETVAAEYSDQGAVVGGGPEAVMYTLAAIRSWFDGSGLEIT